MAQAIYNENKKGYFTEAQIEKIADDAFEILERVGVKILDEPLSQKLKSKGFKFQGKSVLIPKEESRKFLSKLQHRTLEKAKSEEKESFPVEFSFSLNGYSDNIENHLNGEISLFDTPKLIEATKFCNSIIKDYGYQATMPGIAHDIHPDLIPLMSCKIGAQYIEGGWGPDVYSIKIIPYMLEMCEVMNTRIDQVFIFMVNPLTLAGESFRIALELKDSVDFVKVRTLPTLGVSTPLDIPAALSLSMAEVFGGAFVFEELSGVTTDILVSLFPFDFHDLNVMYGSVEKQVLVFMTQELNVKLGFTTEAAAKKKVDLTNLAKKSDFQSIMDNAQTITAGVISGGRSFKSSGCLSCGEIFSPIQMVADLEMMERAKILINGMNMTSGDEDICDKIRCEENKNFFESEQTLYHHREYIWYPKFYDRSPLGTWKAKGMPDVRSRIIDYIEKARQNKNTYRLDDFRFTALEKIYEKAKRITLE